MQSLPSNPFHLRSSLREKLEARLEAVPLFNVLLIAVLLTLLGSRFVFAPGLSVALDENGEISGGNASAGTPARLILPKTSVMLSGAETSSVLTVKSDSMFILDGRIYENLAEAFARGSGGNAAEKNRGTLLVKIDRAVSVQGLFKIAELAGEAGFSALQIAGESPVARPENAR